MSDKGVEAVGPHPAELQEKNNGQVVCLSCVSAHFSTANAHPFLADSKGGVADDDVSHAEAKVARPLHGRLHGILGRQPLAARV